MSNTAWVLFFRAINVSGRNLIKMADLKTLLEQNNFQQVQTYIQSGNVSCIREGINQPMMPALVEGLVNQHFSLEVAVVVKSKPQLHWILQHIANTIPENIDVKGIYITLANKDFPSNAVSLLEPFLLSGEALFCTAEAIILTTPAYGQTKMSNALIEKKLQITATTRNWNTLHKMAHI